MLDPDQRTQGLALSTAIEKAMLSIKPCEQCRHYTEQPVCPICQNTQRIQHQLCVVETPADLHAIEDTNTYRGLYFVLHGYLSPIDGIGPEELHIDALTTLTQDKKITEVILATNATTEGKATAHYIVSRLQPLGISCSRIAQGVPMGGELEYLDSHTLAHAVSSRIHIHS